MSIISKLAKKLKIDASCNASGENEIKELMKSSLINVPNEYLELIREQSEIEISVCNQKYIRIWGADGCIEMNDIYFIQTQTHQTNASLFL